MWLQLPAVHAAPTWATYPPISMPVGSGWLAPWLDPTAAGVARALVLGGALLGLLGVAARPAFAVVTVFGAYLLAIPQFQGGVQHYHHLLWFAALLAVSPSSDALSYRQPKALPGRSLAWGVPTHFAWALLAAVYFFPGVHKLAAQGPAWAGENLVTLLHWKWAQAWDFVPLTRLDRTPALLWVGGVAVLVLELTSPVALLHRATRAAFAVCAGAFHIATALWFDIHFWELWVCLVVLLPFPRPSESRSRVRTAWVPSAVVGVLLLTGVGWAGATRTTQGWPFACYPTFDEPIGQWMPTVAVVGFTTDGQERPVPEHALADPADSKRFYSEVWGVTGLYGIDDPRAHDRFWATIRHRPGVIEALGDATRVEISRARKSVNPDEEGIRRLATVARYEL